MPNEEIIIDIAANGDVTVEGKAITGSDCKALTKEIEAALGTVTRQSLKPEFYQQPVMKRKVGA